MKTTTYICDACNKSVSEKELVTIQMTLNNLFFEDSPNCYKRNSVSKDICKDCLKKRGFTISAVKDENLNNVLTNNNKTLESKMIDILEDLGVAFLE